MRIIQLKSNFGFIIVKKNFELSKEKNFSFLEYILYNLKLSKSKF